MSISGLVIHAQPGRAGDVRAHLAGLDGVEIHAASEDGRLVVTVDVEDERKAADTLMAVQRQKGVLSASLIYNHFDNADGESPAETE